MDAASLAGCEALRSLEQKLRASEREAAAGQRRHEAEALSGQQALGWARA